jgi:superfamily II DNA or RNA helicase
MKPVILLGGTIALPRVLLSAEEVQADWQALACPNPDRNAGVKPFVPLQVSILREDCTHMHYPWGAANLARERLAGKEYGTQDLRPKTTAEPLKYGGKLFPYQERAIASALASKYGGQIVAPVGSGKGEMIVALSAALGLPTLIVAPTKEIARDLHDRVQKRLAVTCGFIGDGKHEVQRITVAIAAALESERLKEPALKAFEVLIFDECHHAASPSWRAISDALPVRKRFGFTATPKRADTLTPFVEHLLGGVLHEVPRSALESAGRSLLPGYEQIQTAYEFDYFGEPDWHPLLADIGTDAERNGLIVETVMGSCMPHSTIVLTGRVEHAVSLAEQITARGERAVALYGKLSTKKRAAILDELRAGTLRVIVATSLADEGLDVPNLARLVLCWPGKAEGRHIQRIGRILRVVAGKASPVVYDLADNKVGPLKWQAIQRAKAFVQEFGQSRKVQVAA